MASVLRWGWADGRSASRDAVWLAVVLLGGGATSVDLSPDGGLAWLPASCCWAVVCVPVVDVLGICGVLKYSFIFVQMRSQAAWGQVFVSASHPAVGCGSAHRRHRAFPVGLYLRT